MAGGLTGVTRYRDDDPVWKEGQGIGLLPCGKSTAQVMLDAPNQEVGGESDERRRPEPTE